MIRTMAALVALLATSFADAAVLWAGGEDIDFPSGSPPAVTTSTSYRRTAYTRCAVASSGMMAKSTVFPGGPVTSAWFSVRMAVIGGYTNRKWIGLGRSGTNGGLFVGTTDAFRIALYKYDGTTWTLLGAEPGPSLLQGVNKVDVHVVDFGPNATVTVYVNGNASITYVGNVAAGTVTSFDSVFMFDSYVWLSEIIVADEDTRLFSMVTLAPNAAGDTNAWTGTYADVSETVVNDASIVTSSIAGQEAQFNLLDLPAGQFAIKGLKLNIRAAESGTSISTIHLGVKTNATAFYDAGRPHTTAWSAQELFLPQNPVTGRAWQPSEIDALQLTLRSAP